MLAWVLNTPPLFEDTLNVLFLYTITFLKSVISLTLSEWEEEGQKAPLPSPTSFSPVTSTNVGIIPQNFLTFSFNPFATLV